MSISYQSILIIDDAQFVNYQNWGFPKSWGYLQIIQKITRTFSDLNLWWLGGPSLKNKIKPTNPNAHTYDNEPRNHSYERRERECKVWSVKCTMWSKKCEVWRLKCTVWSIKCGVSSVQCKVSSVKCGVYSVECGV